jgi:hypothetical protein
MNGLVRTSGQGEGGGDIQIPFTGESMPPAAWLEGIDNDTHHKLVGWSCSKLKDMARSPAHYYSRHVLKQKQADTPAFAFGRIAHAALLEPTRFLKSYKVQPDFGAMQSSKNREARDAWLKDMPPGSIVLTSDQADQIKGMIDSILSHPVGEELLKDGVTERTGYCTDEATGEILRIRPDLLRRDGIMVDVKTTEDASFKGFQRSVFNFGYDMQAGMYLDVGTRIEGKPLHTFAFLAIEKAPPYAVAVYVAGQDVLERGRARYRKALARGIQCRTQGRWPSYQEEAQTITLPAWAMYEEG